MEKAELMRKLEELTSQQAKHIGEKGHEAVNDAALKEITMTMELMQRLHQGVSDSTCCSNKPSVLAHWSLCRWFERGVARTSR